MKELAKLKKTLIGSQDFGLRSSINYVQAIGQPVQEGR